MAIMTSIQFIAKAKTRSHPADPDGLYPALAVVEVTLDAGPGQQQRYGGGLTLILRSTDEADLLLAALGEARTILAREQALQNLAEAKGPRA